MAHLGPDVINFVICAYNMLASAATESTWRQITATGRLVDGLHTAQHT